MTTADPGLGPITNQAQIRFMDQGRRLQGMVRTFTRHPCCGKVSQLIVDQRQKLCGGVRIARLDARQIRVTSDMGARITVTAARGNLLADSWVSAVQRRIWQYSRQLPARSMTP